MEVNLLSDDRVRRLLAFLHPSVNLRENLKEV
jgi:hypothetical protein